MERTHGLKERKMSWESQIHMPILLQWLSKTLRIWAVGGLPSLPELLSRQNETMGREDWGRSNCGHKGLIVLSQSTKGLAVNNTLLSQKVDMSFLPSDQQRDILWTEQPRFS